MPSPRITVTKISPRPSRCWRRRRTPSPALVPARGARRWKFTSSACTSSKEITSGFRGVQRSFAIQAGREVRVLVEPEKITDAMAEMMAMEIAKKIEAELEYPGQIKVTVLREFRATGVAK